MKDGSKFSSCYEHLKLRFYSSFNALYRRSNSSHSELVSVQLGLLTALILLASCIVWFIEVTEPEKPVPVLTMINNLFNRAVYKILKYSIKT